MAANLLDGARALVTGAGRGMGTEIARQLAAHGAAVVLHYRSSRAGAEEAVKAIRGDGGTAYALPADLTDEAEAETLAREAAAALGGLDILVNNAAGFGPLRELKDASWADVEDEWRAVVKPVVALTRAVLPGMLTQGHGRIVNLAATLVARPAVSYGAHTMAKSAVLAYTRTLAREVGPRGVTVNAVSPGVTTTEFTNAMPQDERDGIARQTPLRRLATPEDVARAVVFFASPLAGFVTGANVAPDGGLSLL
jgi:3-oxoacyl-[acyl-carrier protein] reductase